MRNACRGVQAFGREKGRMGGVATPRGLELAQHAYPLQDKSATPRKFMIEIAPDDTEPPPAGQPLGQSDPVREAIAEAIRCATAAGRWDVVVALAGSLSGAPAGDVRPEADSVIMSLDAERARRGGMR